MNATPHPRSAVELAKQRLGIIEARGLAGSKDIHEAAIALRLTIGSIESLVVESLLAVRDQFPASIHTLLVFPTDEVEADRDAFTEDRDHIGFVEILDMLSLGDLPCIAPNLHRGWQDKRESCKSARRVTQGVLGRPIKESTRHALIHAMAIDRRMFRIPGTPIIPMKDIQNALALVLQLLESLPQLSQHESISRHISSIRGQI